MSGTEQRTMPASGLAGGGFRLEIQALRAVAVLIVLVYHIWPGALPGGYVGVDVFFVLSGYLITGILFRQFSSSGRIDVRDFYVRRIRRLLPAAAVVLVTVAVLLPLLPRTQWSDNTAGIVASAVYVQNWWLAGQAVDYLAAESAATAVQHFWSLSVEEQYYIVWPLALMLLGLLPMGWKKQPGRIFAALVFLVVVLSLGYSVWLTDRNPGLAYFSTFTRAWELGVGGLLAVTTSWRYLPQPIRDLLGWIGLVMIMVSAVTFGETTVFPGYAAALPVAGTALVLIAGDSPRWYSAFWLLRRRPFQYFGDISYSLYLWHWPAIVFYGVISGRPPGVLDGVVLIAVSTALAHQSKTLVEDGFRVRKVDGSAARSAYGIAIGSIMLCLMMAWMAPRPWNADAAVAGGPDRLGSTDTALPNPGALALTHVIAMEESPTVPSLSAARRDEPGPYTDRCMSRGSSSELSICEYGDRQSGFRVLLAGDTQAAQWQPALESIALANSWALDVAVKTDCVLGDALPARNGERFSACEEWRDDLLTYIHATRPALVILAQNPAVALVGGETGRERVGVLVASLHAFARSVGDSTQRFVFIRSVPSLGKRCVDDNAWQACGTTRDQAIRKADPVIEAVEALENAVLVDMSDAICSATRCDAVVGNVAVYRSTGHLTATYSRSTAPALAERLASAAGIAVTVPSPPSVETTGEIVQKAIAAPQDNPDLYIDGCHLNQTDFTIRQCVYGDPDGRTTVVLAGDSHAGQWLPALQEIGSKRGWKIYTYTKSACAFNEAPVRLRGSEYVSCAAWNRALMDELRRLRPDVVITSQSRGHHAWGAESAEVSREQLAEGLTRRWTAVQRLGARVLVIADTPWMDHNVPDCLTAPGASPSRCATTRAKAENVPDSIARAAELAPGVPVISMNDEICDATTCPAVRDGEVVWRDRHHLTATFARSLAPALEAAITQSLE